MSNWVHGSRDIEVHFTASLKPRTAHYIQIQMEQRGSGHFSPTFVHKLDAAVQVGLMFALIHLLSVPYVFASRIRFGSFRRAILALLLPTR